MKKLYSLLVASCLALSTMATTVFDFNSSTCLYQTADGFTVTISQAGNGNSKPQYYSNEARLYAKNTITVSGDGITRIDITFAKQGSKAYADLSASEGTLTNGGTSTSNTDLKTDTWTGSSNSVVFTLGSTGQRIIKRLVINGDGTEISGGNEGGDTTVVVTIDTTALDSTFAYSEPTAIIVPDMSFYKQKYAFVQNNIRVSCTQGSILNNDSDYYFNCNAGEKLTFEATKPIKGIVINGYVRKAFSATTDRGSIEYCSPEDNDWEGDPVVIVTDIDSTAVTISCVKQLRCYAVRLYFDANPTDKLDCENNGGEEGEVFYLTFDAADAVYETEITEEDGKTNYTIYLYNQESPDYPYIALDLYPNAVGDLTGTYNLEDGSLGEYTWYSYGESEFDRVWVYSDGAVVVSKNDKTYSISGYITCDDNNTYNFTFSGEMPFYIDTEYYKEDTAAIEAVYPPLNPKAAMYDVLGRRVNKDYRGIVIQDGKKFIVR